MFLILQTIILFVISGNSVNDCSEVIGRYTTLNDKSCGISLFSSEPKLCFKYHNDLPLNLKDSRNALPGEAPWPVFLTFSTVWFTIRTCVGVLIDRQWVMTAAHCLLEGEKPTPKRIWVHLNPVLNQDISHLESEYWSSETKYIHHKFRDNVTHRGFAYDIGLFKLNKPILIQPGVVNSICLPPERNFTYFEDQYAMTTGLHSIYIENNRSLNRLQIANTKVSSHTQVIFADYFPTEVINESYFIWPGYIFGKKIGKQKLCKGDSGSPVWQYYLGRAVLIGILSIGGDANASDYKCQNEGFTGISPKGTRIEKLNETISFIVWIPMMMDWVINVTLFS